MTLKKSLNSIWRKTAPGTFECKTYALWIFFPPEIKKLERGDDFNCSHFLLCIFPEHYGNITTRKAANS